MPSRAFERAADVVGAAGGDAQAEPVGVGRRRARASRGRERVRVGEEQLERLLAHARLELVRGAEGGDRGRR